jgi:hypothetical protein
MNFHPVNTTPPLGSQYILAEKETPFTWSRQTMLVYVMYCTQSQTIPGESKDNKNTVERNSFSDTHQIRELIL